MVELRTLEDRRIIVQGFDFVVNNNTVIEFPQEEFKEGEPVPGIASVNEIDPGLVVRVFSIVTDAGLNIAERIVVETGTDNGVRISGAVSEISEDGFVIRGWNVVGTEYTLLFDENFNEIPFEELEEGQRVLVFGEFVEDGKIQAHHVEYRREERDEFVLFGPITTLEENTLRVWDVDFTLTENTRVEAGPEGDLGIESLSTGQLVEVISIPSTDGVRIVDFIHVPQGVGEAVRVRGKASDITDTSLLVLGQEVISSLKLSFAIDSFKVLIEKKSPTEQSWKSMAALKGKVLSRLMTSSCLEQHVKSWNYGELFKKCNLISSRLGG